MKLIAFAASNSQNSINKALVTYAAHLSEHAEVEVLDLNDYPLPVYSIDIEKAEGEQPKAKAFLEKINHADAIVISFAEHNGNYTVAYKNIFDWCTRIQKKVYEDKKMVLLATSEGGRGAAKVLEIAAESIPRFGGDIKATISVPNFNDNFDSENNQIINQEIADEITVAIKRLTD